MMYIKYDEKNICITYIYSRCVYLGDISHANDKRSDYRETSIQRHRCNHLGRAPNKTITWQRI